MKNFKQYFAFTFLAATVVGCAVPKELQPIVTYFEKYFVPEYACFVHDLIIDKEIRYLQENFSKTVVNITNLDWAGLTYPDNFISFYSIFDQYPGLINHFSKQGNQIIFEKLKETIDAVR